MKNNLKEKITSLCLIVTSILLLNPFHFWMPDMVLMVVLAVVLVLFAIFASFILREKDFDERDVIHRALAGRNAFLAGSAMLIIAISIQGMSHTVDAWLIITLIVMILAKMYTRIWSDKNM